MAWFSAQVEWALNVVLDDFAVPGIYSLSKFSESCSISGLGALDIDDYFTDLPDNAIVELISF